MGKFGDKIKERLNEGEIEFSDSSWEKMDKKLSESSSQTPFEQKIQGTFSEGTVIMPDGSWNNFNENSNLLNNFEKNLSEKLNSGKYKSNENNWDDFSEKYTNSRLTSFEKTIKNALNSRKLGTNNIHWKAFEKILHVNRVKKIFWRSAAAVLLLITAGFGINQFSKKGTDSLYDNPHLKNIDITRNNVFKLNEKTSFKQKTITINSMSTKNSSEIPLAKKLFLNKKVYK